MRTFAAMLVALAAMLTPLTYAPVTYAETPDLDPAPASEEADQQKLELATGNPSATSAGDMRLEGAAITWTPTGLADVQDTYELIVSRQNLAEGEDKLSREILMSPVGLTEARQDITAFGEGTFYWQVRSCVIGTACKDWSGVYVVNVDGTAPEPLVAAVSSGKYEQIVRMQGTAEANGKVIVRVGETTCDALADTTGAWGCTLPGEIEYGEYQAVVTAFDKAGNASQPLEIDFIIKELFVAPPIKAEELPAVLDIVPIATGVENKVFKQPISVIDSVNMAEEATEPLGSVLGASAKPLSTEGGVVQSSESGWQVLGMPWFLWAGIGGILSAGWFVSSGRSLRSFAFN